MTQTFIEVIANSDENNGDGFWNTKPSKTNTRKISRVKQASEHTNKSKRNTNKQVKQHKRNVLISRLNLNKINNKYNNKHGQQQTQRVTSYSQNNVTKQTHMKQNNKSNKSRTWLRRLILITHHKQADDMTQWLLNSHTSLKEQVKWHKCNVSISHLNLNKTNNKHDNKHGQRQTQCVKSRSQNKVTKQTHETK